jgi:hypothetical protein
MSMGIDGIAGRCNATVPPRRSLHCSAGKDAGFDNGQPYSHSEVNRSVMLLISLIFTSCPYPPDHQKYHYLKIEIFGLKGAATPE